MPGHIIVEQDSRDAAPSLEGMVVASQEAVHAGAEEKAQDNVAGMAEHHDEGHDRAPCAADSQVPAMGPIDLGLLAGQGGQAQKGFGFGAWTMYYPAGTLSKRKIEPGNCHAIVENRITVKTVHCIVGNPRKIA